MIKYRRSLEGIVLFWLMFLVILGVCLWIIITSKWNLHDSIILCCILEYPTYFMLPRTYQMIKIDDQRIVLCWWHVKLRNFLWSEVQETGIAYTRGGYGTYKKFVFISKRPVTDKERFNIHGVKDKKSFITMENRGNIIEDIKKYSKLPFRDLPTTEDFNNM